MQMRKMGEKIVEHSRTLTLGNISWAKFPDGFPNIFVHDVESFKVRIPIYDRCLWPRTPASVLFGYIRIDYECLAFNVVDEYLKSI
jgi:hypothetical protein